MNEADEAELHRLCECLRQIEERGKVSTAEREALRKAALALHQVFLAGRRAELEDSFGSIDQPLSEADREHLRSMGINPEA